MSVFLPLRVFFVFVFSYKCNCQIVFIEKLLGIFEITLNLWINLEIFMILCCLVCVSGLSGQTQLQYSQELHAFLSLLVGPPPLLLLTPNMFLSLLFIFIGFLRHSHTVWSKLAWNS